MNEIFVIKFFMEKDFVLSYIIGMVSSFNFICFYFVEINIWCIGYQENIFYWLRVLVTKSFIFMNKNGGGVFDGNVMFAFFWYF